MRISDWSSDVCSSDLLDALLDQAVVIIVEFVGADVDRDMVHRPVRRHETTLRRQRGGGRDAGNGRSEEHTSELQSLMRISYAVFCLKKKTNKHKSIHTYEQYK